MRCSIADDSLYIIACTHQQSYELLSSKEAKNLIIQHVSAPDGLSLSTTIVILDHLSLQTFGCQEWLGACSDAIFVVEYCSEIEALPDNIILIPAGLPEVFLQNALVKALEYKSTLEQLALSKDCLKLEQNQISRLLGVGQALSAERDHEVLLGKILTEARSLASCDAASIFLVDRHSGENNKKPPELVFKLTQNDSIDFHFEEQRFPLDSRSVSGYSALTGEIVNIRDVYALPKGSIYKFNNSFDVEMGYRTRSMLVIPMRNHKGRVIAVIQFINRKTSVLNRDPDLSANKSNPESVEDIIEFDAQIVPILQALASQASVAIENNLLIDRVNMLFDGFVKGAVRAIEQRDPTTSGHSFRVAELTSALAERVSCCEVGHFKDVSFNSDEMKELKYASLLHDFGKVGVREHILTKAKKLSPEAYGLFVYRIAWEKERVSNYYLQQKLNLLKQQKLSSEVEERLGIEEQYKLQKLSRYLQAVADANEPSVLSEGTFEHLKQIREYVIKDANGEARGLIDDFEFGALSIKRGSLTADERLEIESHVSHTIEFLSTIPWTPELSNIPKIAGAHHEKLNGCGYPNGLHSHEIPLGAKIMAVCDIFDALTARDRPYKAAVPLERALSILHSEVECGHIDPELVELFQQAKVYEILK